MVFSMLVNMSQASATEPQKSWLPFTRSIRPFFGLTSLSHGCDSKILEAFQKKQKKKKKTKTLFSNTYYTNENKKPFRRKRLITPHSCSIWQYIRQWRMLFTSTFQELDKHVQFSLFAIPNSMPEECTQISH